MQITLSLPKSIGRVQITPQQAEATVKQWQKHIKTCQDSCDGDVHVHRLDVGCCAWRAESIKVIQPFLEENVVSSIVTLNLDDVIASLMTEEGLDAFKVWTDIFKSARNLKHLGLADNAMGTRVFKIMEPVFQLPLQSISFHNCGMAAECGDSLYEILTKGEVATTLMSLNLGRNQLSVAGAKAVGKLIPHCPNLTVLQYAGSRPVKEGTKYVLEGLQELIVNKSCTNLKVLDLTDCTFGSGEEDEDSVDILRNILARLPNLSKLYLGDGELELDGLKLVFEGLKESKAQLQVLDLSNLYVGPEGGELIGDFIESTQQYLTLTELYINANELGLTGLQAACLPLLGQTQLSVLVVSENELDNASVLWLIDANWKHLKKLNLLENADITMSYAKKLKSAYSLTKVEFDDDLEDDGENDADEGDVDELTSALGATKI